MAARGSKNAQARMSAERARLHTARAQWHEGQIRRRVRDNTIAAIAASLIVVAAIGSQVLHAQATVPAPEPTSTPSVEPSTVPTDPPSPEPSETQAE